MKPRILLIGKNGQIGAELRSLLQKSCELTALGREDLDLISADSIRAAIRKLQPALIVNAAAYTAVDQAETHKAEAHALNAVAPAIMAEEAKLLGAALIHYSTDYVFDGSQRTPYTEDDPTNPLNVYGKTKLAGEQAIRNAGCAHLILRTEWVYGTRGKNFLLTLVRLGTEREELRIVADQIGAPTWSRSIALATAQLIAQEWRRPIEASPFSNCSGTYHMTARGESNWSQFANAIVDEASKLPHGTAWLETATGGRPWMVRRICAITSENYPTPARRPRYSILNNSRIGQTFGIQLADWRTELQRCMRDEQSLVSNWRES